jgi:hypothetical protein
MDDKPDEAKQSRLRPYRWPMQLVTVGVAAGLWMFGLVGGYTAIMIAILPGVVIYNYEWLHRVLHQTPQK